MNITRKRVHGLIFFTRTSLQKRSSGKFNNFFEVKFFGPNSKILLQHIIKKMKAAHNFPPVNRPVEGHVEVVREGDDLILDLANHSSSKGIGTGYTIPPDVTVCLQFISETGG